eukprot:1794651-Prymnesium_polylepis.1
MHTSSRATRCGTARRWCATSSAPVASRNPAAAGSACRPTGGHAAWRSKPHVVPDCVLRSD